MRFRDSPVPLHTQGALSCTLPSINLLSSLPMPEPEHFMATFAKRDNRSRITPPPPIRTWDGTQPECADVLNDVPGDLGVLLWIGLRRVHLWLRLRDECEPTALEPAAETAATELTDPPPATDSKSKPSAPSLVPVQEEHSDLNAAIQHAPPLRDALHTFALLNQAPDLVRESQLVEACEHVSRWADQNEKLVTATYFAEAAAYLDRSDPARANEAGRLCRRAALDFRAAMWLYRAFGLGVQTKKRTQCTIALLRYGILLHHLCAYDEAEKYLEKAKRRAIRAGQRREAAAAHHELLGLAAEARSIENGERHVMEALWLYPRNHERLPLLVYDFTYLLCEKYLYSYAASLIPAVIERVRSPALQALVWGNAARAYAATGRRLQYKEAVEQAQELATKYHENASGALTMAAVAAWISQDLERATAMALRGREVAEIRKERVAIRRATEVLNGIQNGLPAPREADAPEASHIELVCRQCLARLRKWKPRP